MSAHKRMRLDFANVYEALNEMESRYVLLVDHFGVEYWGSTYEGTNVHCRQKCKLEHSCYPLFSFQAPQK